MGIFQKPRRNLEGQKTVKTQNFIAFEDDILDRYRTEISGFPGDSGFEVRDPENIPSQS